MKQQDPEFSREAGRVLASPYFTTPPPDIDGEELREWWSKKHSEKHALMDAANDAATYDDLDSDSKAVYDRAHDDVVNAMAQQDLYERLHGG